MLSPPHDAAPCPDIGEGWSIQTVARKTGNQVDRYFYSPCGQRFRSRVEVDRFLHPDKVKRSCHELDKIKHVLGKVIFKSFCLNDAGEEREFEGTITEYDSKRKLYKTVYEDGDEEEMSEGEVDRLLSRTKNKKRKLFIKSEAKSASSAKNKQESTVEIASNNHCKKMYMPKKSPSENVKRNNLTDSAPKNMIRSNEISVKPPIVNTSPEDKQSNIIVNRLPAARTSKSLTTSDTNTSSISIQPVAQHRLNAAKRWVATATTNIKSLRQQLDAAIKLKHEALKEQLEATEFLHYAKSISGGSSRSTRKIKKRTPVSSKKSKKQTNETKLVPILADENIKASNEYCQNKPLIEFKTKSIPPLQQTSHLPLKKRAPTDDAADLNTHNGCIGDCKSKNGEKANQHDPLEVQEDQINHMVTLEPSTENCRFADLTPESQEILRKTILSALSNNRKVDPTVLKRAVAIGIPEQSIFNAVNVAWLKLRSNVASLNSTGSSGRVLLGIELRGFEKSEFDGIYERIDKTIIPTCQPCFQKNGSIVHRLYYAADNWEISVVDKVGRMGKMKYTGSIARSEKSSDSDCDKSFAKTWMSFAGNECRVTITPLYGEQL